MLRETLSVLLIEDSPDYAGLVQQWLAGAGEDVAFVLSWTDTLADGLNRLSQGGIDAALVDLDLPDSYGAETYLGIRARAPNVPVIILSAADSESLALQMIQEGAEDYLVKSTCTPDLLSRTVRYAVLRRKSQSNRATGGAAGKARMLGLVGVKGGVGTTTIACNFAAALRHQTGQRVLLADLDLHSGLASFLLDLDPTYSLVDAVKNIERLDRSCLEAIIVRGAGGLDFICSPPIFDAEDLDVEDLRRVLTLISFSYDWIVIDFGRLNRIAMRLVEGVDDLFLTTTPALPALHESKRVIDALMRAGTGPEKLRLIINQTTGVEALSGGEMKQIFGIDIFGTVSNESKELHEYCLQRKLPPETSNIGSQISKMVRRLTGFESKKTKKKIPGLLSLVGLRKAEDDAAAVTD